MSITTIILKHNTTASVTPASLNTGELAINTGDGKLYYGDNSNNAQLVSISGSGGGGTTNTGSLASTGSNTFKGDQIISGSLTVTGSTTLTGLTTATQTNVVGIDANGKLYQQSATAASVFPYTGSAIISGSLTVTGSVNITGSTTQIGNNNLYGSTTLSGSIQISGSVNALADITMGGVFRLDPATDPGNTNATASFLFTSASNTAQGYDLYYRQDGNLVKFKWLEGGISSGILYGGKVSGSGTTIYVSSGSGIILNPNASFNAEINPIYTYVTWGNYSASAQYLTSSQNTYIYVDNAGVVHQQTSFFDQTQYEQAIPLGRVTHANYTSITSVGSNVQTTYDSDSQQSDFIRAFGPIKVNGFTPSGQSGSLRINIGEGTAFNLGGYYSQDPNSPSHYTSTPALTASLIRAYRTGSIIYQDNNGGAFYTVVDPTKYDNGNGLSSVAGGLYTIQRIFYNPATKRCTIYYGQNTYVSIATALTNLPTDSFTEGEFTAKSLVFAGYLIVKGSPTADLANPSDALFIQAGILRNIAGGSSGVANIAQALDDLSDVNISSPSNGQALIYNGGSWVNGTPSSASYASTASLAPNYVLNSATSSFVTNSQTSSFVTNAQTSSFVTNSQTSSFVTNSQTSSFVLNSQTSSMTAGTASKVQGGTANYIPLWTAGTTLGSSALYQSGTSIGLGTTSPNTNLHIVTSSAQPLFNIENTKTDGYSNMRFTGTGQKFVLGVGNASETSFGLANKFFIYDDTNGVVRFTVDNTGAATFTNNLTVQGLTANRALATDSTDQLVSSATTDTELGYLSGVTSAIQTQLNTKGYTLSVISLASNLAAGSTYYFGNQPRALLGTATNTKVFIPKTGTIKRAEISSYASTTAGTAQNISLYVRLNDTTETLIATVGAATAYRSFTNTGLSISVTAGDYIEIKVVVATPYTTPPAGITFGGNLYIE